MKRITLSVALSTALLFTGIAFASSYMILEKTKSSADYILPAPLNRAHLGVSSEGLSLQVAGRKVPVGNAWLRAIPGIDLHSASVARAFDDASRLFILINCARDDTGELGRVVLEISNFAVVNRIIDGCAGV